eukprot:TRINITY_DN468_c0_g1_i1.p1 TRINITY_DN468_c0_g1~~TRINITY_DN468_c0_g1_i1.p1  ORF type:complete len:751 (-),score=246.44 TRINITY_DN468_c0_g1_i1:57-2309(-)
MKSEKRGSGKRKVVRPPRGGSHSTRPRPRVVPPPPPAHLHAGAQDKPASATLESKDKHTDTSVVHHDSPCVMSLEDIEGGERKRYSSKFLRGLRESPLVKSAKYNPSEFPEMVQLTYVAKDPPPYTPKNGITRQKVVKVVGLKRQDKPDRLPVNDLTMVDWRRPVATKPLVRDEKLEEEWDDDDILGDGSMGMLTLSDFSKQARDFDAERKKAHTSGRREMEKAEKEREQYDYAWGSLEEEGKESFGRQEEGLEQAYQDEEIDFQSSTHHVEQGKERVDEGMKDGAFVMEENQVPPEEDDSNPSLIKLSDLEAGAEWDENGMLKEDVGGRNSPLSSEFFSESFPSQGVPIESLHQLEENETGVVLDGVSMDGTEEQVGETGYYGDSMAGFVPGMWGQPVPPMVAVDMDQPIGSSGGMEFSGFPYFGRIVPEQFQEDGGFPHMPDPYGAMPFLDQDESGAMSVGRVQDVRDLEAARMGSKNEQPAVATEESHLAGTALPVVFHPTSVMSSATPIDEQVGKGSRVKTPKSLKKKIRVVPRHKLVGNRLKKDVSPNGEKAGSTPSPTKQLGEDESEIVMKKTKKKKEEVVVHGAERVEGVKQAQKIVDLSPEPRETTSSKTALSIENLEASLLGESDVGDVEHSGHAVESSGPAMMDGSRYGMWSQEHHPHHLGMPPMFMMPGGGMMPPHMHPGMFPVPYGFRGGVPMMRPYGPHMMPPPHPPHGMAPPPHGMPMMGMPGYGMMYPGGHEGPK